MQYQLSGETIQIDPEDVQIAQSMSFKYWKGYKDRVTKTYFLTPPEIYPQTALHRLITKASPHHIVSFKNEDDHDLRKSNLVVMTRKEHCKHMREKQKANQIAASKVPPVSSKPLKVEIEVDGTKYRTTLGSKVEAVIKQGVDTFGSKDDYLAYLVMKEMAS